MPKFIKGSLEMKNHMAELRAKRGTKTSTHKAVKKEHIKKIVSEALEKYYMSGTAVVEVPTQVVKVDNAGNAKLIDTLTKSGNLKKVNGENVIKINSGDDLVIQTKGKKYNEAVNLPSQTILHKAQEKKSRIKITPTEKESNNEVIEMKNEIIPTQKIKHHPHKKTIRRASIEPYSDIIEVGNVDIEPLKKNTTSEKIRKSTRTRKPRNMFDL
jgi:phosphosulfolactate synthase (CoM biosynthesis protein A)